ncbi:MAG: hypothetical protein ACU0DT_01910 [Albimonas sp.]|uniref:hypothetical protein n=1 Tax=Albimonas sp. TaxID=1872425 RepID=UPI004056EC43|tara:strand:+ start:305 stop:607 length:303 start_codon:yes stop_codon:yes gene_type:complete
MRDLASLPPRDEPEGILLARVEGRFWLLAGEAHLDALLANRPGYPTPVRCLRFGSDLGLRRFLADQGAEPEALWSIHPAIVARLVRHDELAWIDLAGGEG